MHIQKIELENYGPFYGRHEFVFEDRGLTLIMGDNQDEPRMNSNGAGKSSILDGLDFCLFGKIPRQDHVDSIVNDEAKACSVTVYLLDDLGRNVIVRRKRSTTTTLELFIFGELQQALDVSETQKRVEEILGVDRDVFHAAVLFAQTDLTHYAESTDTERMNILTKILQLDEIDQWLDATKIFGKKSRQIFDSLTAQFDAKNQVRASLYEKNFDSDIEAWEESRLARLANVQQLIESNIETRKGYVQEADNAVIANQFKIDGMRKELAALVPPDDFALRDLQHKAQLVEGELFGYMRQYAEREDELRKWREKGEGVCSECGQMVTAEHLRDEIQKRDWELEARQQDINARSKGLLDMQSEVGGLKAIYAQNREAYQREVQQRTYDIGVYEQRLASQRENEARINALDVEVQRLDKMYVDIQKEINPFVRQYAENEQAKKQIEFELQSLHTQHEDMMARQAYIDFWVNAFGPKGLKSYILDARLQELTDAVNQWVTVLTGGTIWVEFSTQKKTRSKKLVNSPTVRICRWNPDGTITERNFNSWSGGEKQRISFAIDFGLSRLIAQRAKKSYNLLILDEVFQHLDQGGKEAVMDMLQSLAQEKSSVFVVEHDTEFQSAFENRVIVRKKNRRSTIEELSNGQSDGIENEAEATGTTAKRETLPVKAVDRKRVIRTPI